MDRPVRVLARVSEPVPQRIGDAERDRAADYLREHMSVGRLSQEEFDERVTAALQARTAADLEPLVQRPAGAQARPGRGGRRRRPVAGLPAAGATPAADPSAALADAEQQRGEPAGARSRDQPGCCGWCLNFAFGWDLWWLVFIPIVISSIAGQQKEELKRREKLWQKQQNPQLPPGSQTDPPSS